MKQTFKLFAVALIAGTFTLIGYKYFMEENEIAFIQQEEKPSVINASYSATIPVELDFTEAAEKTIHAVVHVKNTTMARQTNSVQNYFFGGGQPRAMVGSGSGVIIS
ncbi:MAG: serine protease, partial [Flavobacteriaceae bacterium]